MGGGELSFPIDATTAYFFHYFQKHRVNSSAQHQTLLKLCKLSILPGERDQVKILKHSSVRTCCQDNQLVKK